MMEELFVKKLPDGRTFRCVKSQLQKTNGYDPHDPTKLVYAEYQRG